MSRDFWNSWKITQLELDVEDDINIQKEQVKNMEIIERAILLSEQELSEVKEFKNTMLSKLFVADRWQNSVLNFYNKLSCHIGF